jgi:inhibitor of cysteine peptidase
MKFALLTCLALVWLATAQAGEQEPIAVTVGKEFKITLQYNATTGYQWVLAKPPDEKLVKLLRTEYKRLDTKLVGAGGDMVWTFQALAEGKTKLELNYVRPWEKGEKPAQTTNLVVVIKPVKEKVKKPAAGPSPGS